MYTYTGLIAEAFSAGAVGFVHKQSAHADLVSVIRAVLAGETFLSLSLRQGATPPQQDGDGGQSNKRRRVRTPKSPVSMVRNCQLISATDDHRARWHQRTALAYGA
jgi:DNA-binding NarL/FixJ family response regulator